MRIAAMHIHMYTGVCVYISERDPTALPSLGLVFVLTMPMTTISTIFISHSRFHIE